MKKLVYILVSVVLLSGCTIDSPVVYDPELRMLFLPEVYRHGGEDDQAHYPDDQSFAICAWASGEELFPLSKAYSQEVVLADSTRKIPVTDTLWAFEQEVMWPSKSEKVFFTAYSPYEVECQVTKDEGVLWSTDVLEEQTDLLYSHAEIDRSMNVDGNVAHICFSRALCRIGFRVKNRVDNTGATDQLNRPDKITVKSIVIDGVKHKGTFRSLPSAEWTLQEDKAPLTIFEGAYLTSGVPEEIGTIWLMVPQKLETTITVVFDYTTFANTTITQKIKTVPMTAELSSGGDYTYTLSVGIDDVKFLHELLDKDEQEEENKDE